MHAGKISPWNWKKSPTMPINTEAMQLLFSYSHRDHSFESPQLKEATPRMLDGLPLCNYQRSWYVQPVRRIFHILCTGLYLLLLAIPAKAEEPKPSHDEIRKAISGLGTDSFIKRYTAQAHLTKMIDAHPQELLPYLLRDIPSAEDPEIQFRMNEVVFSLYRSRIINKPRGFLGIRLAPTFMAPAQPGRELQQVIEVLDVIPDTAAAKADLQLRDRILLVDGLDVGPKNPKGGFIDYIYSRAPGTVVSLKIMRLNRVFDLDLPLGERPPDLPLRTSLQKSQDDLYRDWLEAAKVAVENGNPIVFE